MMLVRTLLLAAITISTCHATAQDEASEWTRAQAVEELQVLIDMGFPSRQNKPPSREQMEARKQGIADWAARARETNLDLGEDECLLAIADYMNGQRTAASDALFAYIAEHGELPESMNTLRGFVPRMLPPRLNTAIDSGEWADFNRVMPVAVEWSDDPYPFIASVGAVVRSTPGDDARTALLGMVAILLTDERIEPIEREAFLERVYGQSEPKPEPKPKQVDGQARGVGDARPRLITAGDARKADQNVPFKPFAGPDLQGGEISTLEFGKGKVVLIDFWATWCGPCIREMPNIVELQKKYGDKGLAILGVSLDRPEATQKILDTMKRLEMDWPQIYDGMGWKTAPARLNNIRSIPSTIILDRNGKARYANLRGEKLEAAVRTLLDLAPAPELEDVDLAEAPLEGYEALAKDLGVTQRQHLLMWRSNDEGLQKLATFRAGNPDSEDMDKVMYLQAIGLWNLYRYEDAAGAYDEYLERFPDKQLSSLAMTRHVQSLIRSDQADAALAAIEEYSDGVAADQRELHAADALALAGRTAEARALLKSWMALTELPKGSERMKDMAKAQYDRLGWVGKPLMGFEVPAHDDGDPLSPDTFRGDVLLIDFWASWCRPCMAQMPHLKELHEKYHQRGFEIFGVSLDDDESRMEGAMERAKITWPVFYDGQKWKNELAQQFEVRRIPTMILVDRNGIVRAVDPPPAAVSRLVADLIEQE
ncbi:MAG: TlpA family protein disulfide reductase [Phycisphaerales bacterium]|nr:TlpA family protein disulfide reductase [Phycisphaerales bacterium]